MMSHVDFIISFVLILSTIFLVIYFVSNSISNNVDDMVLDELKVASASMKTYLFEISDDKSLASNVKEIDVILTETNGTQHTEQISMSIKPNVDRVRVYDSLMNEIPSSSNDMPEETVLSFSMTFDPNEKKTAKVFYFGNSVNDVDMSGNNLTFRAISDKDVSIVSQEKCSDLKNVDYESIRNTFDFKHQFRLELKDCGFGLETPSKANIIIRSIPVIFENSDGSLSGEFARLIVW